ncbi:type II toxin-antitoxin system RelE/ParE family toxin [Accumulibacter sp.]|uniref:type II toxin-antitoxin system RelE/ParE family toxin n=1 Tax=Accumulibacter sp. TaxID=2053492 RepID=UPI003DA8A376
MLAIGRDPLLGHRRDDLPETHRLYLVGAHVIIYRADEAGVVRILHQRMSLTRHLRS